MPFLESAGVNEPHIRRNQSFAFCPDQIVPIAIGGDHPQVMLTSQALYRRPSEEALRALIGVTSNCRQENFHFERLTAELPVRTIQKVRGRRTFDHGEALAIRALISTD